MKKPYDLEERTLIFGKQVIYLCQRLPKNTVNLKLIDQVLRSATSVGANYREANETDTKKDFKNRIRIAKKEAKETIYWFQLLLDANPDLTNELTETLHESEELMKILGSIYEKTKFGA